MRSILWRGIPYKSWEHCKIEKDPNGFFVNSEITGSYQGQVYSVLYGLKIDRNWRVNEFNISADVEGVEKKLAGRKGGEDWLIDNTVIAEFSGLLYIDISVTPFTNTLPVNNLLLDIGESTEIDVLYIDVLNHKIEMVKQRYTRKTKDQYFYENLNSDFSALIQFDSKGIVKSYPGLFEEVSESGTE